MEQVVKENKMGVMPVNKLLLNMSVPLMISMIVQALYNIVDSIFVAQIDEYALTAVSLAFPMQTLLIAVSAGTGVGVNALVSKRLGQKRFDDANLAAGNALTLSIISYVVFLLLGIFAARPFFAVQTDIGTIVEYGHSYLSIILVFSFGLYGQICFERLFQSTGKTIYTMITQTTGAVINIILDPILIFGLGPFPELGIVGAAYATVLGQIIAFVMAVVLHQLKNKEIQLSLAGMKLDKETVKIIYKVGVPAILMQSIGSVMTFGMNKILMSFTSTATAVFGVYFKLQSIIFMPIFGLNNGCVPIIAYNFGARYKERIHKTIKYAVGYAVAIMLIGLIFAETIPDKMLLLFNASENMLEIGVPAIRIMCLIFIVAGYTVIAMGVFQALGNAMYSLIVSICRQLLLLLPLAYFFSRTGNLELVWAAFPIAEGISLVITVFLMKKTMNKLNVALDSKSSN